MKKSLVGSYKSRHNTFYLGTIHAMIARLASSIVHIARNRQNVSIPEKLKDFTVACIFNVSIFGLFEVIKDLQLMPWVIYLKELELSKQDDNIVFIVCDALMKLAKYSLIFMPFFVAAVRLCSVKIIDFEKSYTLGLLAFIVTFSGAYMTANFLVSYSKMILRKFCYSNSNLCNNIVCVLMISFAGFSLWELINIINGKNGNPKAELVYAGILLIVILGLVVLHIYNGFFYTNESIIFKSL